MHNIHTYNPILMRHINSFVSDRNWQGLEWYFAGLSNSEFRTACNMMADDVAPLLQEPDYWDCFRQLFCSNSKAWLVTMLKAGVRLYANGNLLFQGKVFNEICRIIVNEGRKIDERKLLQNILPVLKTPEEIEIVIQSLHLDEEPAARYLM